MASALVEDSRYIEKLIDADTFQIWKFQLNILFKANDLDDIVGVYTDVERRDNKWKKKDAIAQKLIVTTLDRRPLVHVMNCETSYDMWKKLSAVYERDNAQQKCSLLQSFYTLE